MLEKILVRGLFGTFFVCLAITIVMSILPSKPKQTGFAYDGKTYTFSESKQQGRGDVVLSPEKERMIRELHENCQIQLRGRRFNPVYVCD